jgi:cysteine desulfurase
MRPHFVEWYGNPLGLYRNAVAARSEISEARQRVATFIGSDIDEVIFLSNGTEANNTAIKGLAWANENRGRHIVLSAVEHHSVLYAARSLEKQGFELSLIPVNTYGVVDLSKLDRAMRDDTILVAVMHSNDEVGSTQPIREIGNLVHERGALLHTDAVCSAGILPFDVKETPVDSASISAQSMGGGQGAAALFVRQGTRIRPLLDGGIQENGRRGGQENTAAIVGFGVASALAASEMSTRNSHVRALTLRLLNGLQHKISGIRLNGHPEHRIPGHLSLTIPDADSESVVLMLDADGVAASVGSSCSTHTEKSSHVLRAIGLSNRDARSTLLLTLGPSNTNDEIDKTIVALSSIVDRLRLIAGANGSCHRVSQ